MLKQPCCLSQGYTQFTAQSIQPWILLLVINRLKLVGCLALLVLFSASIEIVIGQYLLLQLLFQWIFKIGNQNSQLKNVSQYLNIQNFQCGKCIDFTPVSLNNAILKEGDSWHVFAQEPSMNVKVFLVMTDNLVTDCFVYNFLWFIQSEC